MFKTRFIWKLYAGYAALILVTTVLVGVFASRTIEEDSERDAESSLRDQANLLEHLAMPYLSMESDAPIEVPITSLHPGKGTRYTIIDVHGRVIADNYSDPESMENHAKREEVLKARDQGDGVSKRYSDTVKTQFLYYARRISDPGSGETLGYVRTSLPLQNIDSKLANLRWQVTLGAIVALVVGLGLGLFVARRITKPLADLTRSAESISAGEYDLRTQEDSTDELGRLSAAFNHMSSQLKSRIGNLARERSQVLAILSSMVEGVIAVDDQQRVLHINNAAREILSVSVLDESEHKPLWEVARIAAINDSLEEVLDGGEDIIREVHIATEKRERIVEIHATPLRQGGSDPAGAVIVLYDTTELRRLERVRSDFVANVSHELKTPLTAIRGMVETLLDDPEIDEVTRNRFLDRIGSQTARLTSIVSDLLTLSRVESKAADEESPVINLHEIISRTCEYHRSNAESRQLTLTYDPGDTGLFVKGDEVDFRQLMDNLLDNALKYTQEGGVNVRLRANGEQCLIQVQDTGQGIPSNHLARIFERFYRVDKARSRALGGTGLGLAIVKHIAMSMDGNVTVTSTVGKGTTFTLTLPLVATAPAQLSAEA